MTTLKIIGIVLVGLVAVIAILVAVAPKQIKVRSEVLINAPKTNVLDHVRYFGKYTTWSPWLDTDPQQKNHVTGTDGQVGVQFHWTSVSEKGKGYQELTKLTDSEIKIKCHIQEPFQSEPDFVYHFEETPNGTKVVYEFETAMPAPTNVIGMLIGLEGNIKTTNDRALVNLKQVCEGKQLAGR